EDRHGTGGQAEGSWGDLMASLVIAEHDNKMLKDATAKTVTAAVQVSTPVHVLVAGSGCSSVAEAAAKLAGVEKVLMADDPLYAHAVAEPMQTLILSLAGNYDAILRAVEWRGSSGQAAGLALYAAAGA